MERERLLALVLCRDVLVNGGRITDPRELVSFDDVIDIREGGYVSRGGIKLQHALDTWRVDVKDKVFIDAGASTGGFTHCLLDYGARRVYSVDVGYNQLSYQLRRDPRVVVMEQTNIMAVEDLDPAPHAAVADLSFRSIGGAAPHILSQTTEHWLIALIKPQFELQHELPTFDGVVRDAAVQRTILKKVSTALYEEGVGVERITASPIPGKKGNREFLALLRFCDDADSSCLSREELYRQIEQL